MLMNRCAGTCNQENPLNLPTRRQCFYAYGSNLFLASLDLQFKE